MESYRMKIYIAGPMKGIAESNIPAFKAAAVKLRELGYEVVSPHEITEYHPYMTQVQDDGSLPTHCYHEFIRLDLIELLQSCDTVVLLPNWQISKGATGEVLVAQSVGFPIYELANFPHHQFNGRLTITVPLS